MFWKRPGDRAEGKECYSMIFDTHAHYDDEKFDKDREELLASFPQKGIGGVVNVAASLGTTKTTLELSEQYDWMFASVGVHPNEVGELDDAGMQWLFEQAGHEKCVAVGEIGLDYYWNKSEKDVQKKWFIRQIELARAVRKPVIVHSREAAQDTFEIIRAEHAEKMGGVIHCFSYSWELAREYLKMGFYLGIGGVVTFKNARKLKEVVKNAPLSRLVLETDSPYLAPVPFRAKRNSSLNLPYVVEELAQLKGITPEEVERVTWDNALRMYGLEGRI